MVRNYIRKGATRYPFYDWFRQRSFKLVHGVDYFCHTYSMVQQIRNAAKLPQHWKKVSIDVARDAKSITVHVRDREDEGNE